MKKKFLVDVGSNYLIYGLQLVIGLISLPIYLNSFGEDLYGVYLLSIGLAGSLLFLEFGSGKSLIKYVAEYQLDGKENKYRLALQTCLAITLASSLVVGAVFLLLAVTRNHIFHIPPEYSATSYWLLTYSGLYAAILILAQLPQSMLKGGGVFYQRNKLSVLELLLRGLLILGVAIWDISIFWLLGGEIAILLISICFDFYVINRVAPGLLRLDLLTHPSLRAIGQGEVWQYAKGSFYLSVISFFSQNSDRLVIGLVLDVRFVTIYTILTKPYGVIKSLLSKMYVVLQPYYLKVLAQGGNSKLTSFLMEGGKMSAIVTGIAMSGLVIALPELVSWWLGTDAYQSYMIYGQLLLGVLAVRSLTTMIYQSLYIIGKTSELLKVESILVGTNLLLSLVLVNLIGVGGVIVGTIVQLLLVVPFMIDLGNKYIGSAAPGQRPFNSMHPWFTLALIYLTVLMIPNLLILSGVLVVSQTVIIVAGIVTPCLLLIGWSGYLVGRIKSLRVDYPVF